MKKSILVVDSSSVVRRYVKKLLEENEYRVESAKNAQEAFTLLHKEHFSLVILDVTLSVGNDSELLHFLVHDKATRVLMLGEISNADNSFEALEMGAIDYIMKPQKSVDIVNISEELLQKVKKILLILPQNMKRKKPEDMLRSVTYESDIEMSFVLVGASTGGPRLIESICKNLPADYPHSVCVVQHMPTEFTANFAARLNKLSAVEVVEADNGVELKKGRVIIAKGGKHLHIRKKLKSFSVVLAPNTRERFFVPSVDEMFLSALESLPMKKLLAVELTGIGDDGADGMVALKKRGAYTLAESEESAVVYGMPKEAAIRGGATKVLPFEKILHEIINYGQ